MQEIAQAISAIVKELFGIDTDVELTRPDEQFGDYATNVALQLAQTLDKKPRDIAEQIVAGLNHESIVKTEVAGPGFINITLSDSALQQLIDATPAKSLEGQVIVAEYSDPNPFKVLHAGHLYTTLVGDAVANLLVVAGADVKRVNFGGDVGLHVAKAMWGILQAVGNEEPETFLSKIDERLRPNWVSERYVEGNTAYEENEAAKAEITSINQQVYDVQAQEDHNSNFAKIYWTCRQWSYDGFEKLYADLGVHGFDKYYPESDTTPMGLQSVEELLNKGVLEKSDGAVVYKGEKDGLHTRVFLNSNGLPTYEAKDLGLARRKWEDYHFDKSIMITANDIQQYMKVILKVVSFIDPNISERSSHITHGVVKLAGGQKMSSRKGNVLLAGDVLTAATDANKATTGKEDMSVVLGAVKYAFLKNRIGGDVIYDPKESVSLEGNSGPYLQYAHARAKSILRKAGSTSESAIVINYEPGERSLARKLGEYAETIDKAATELMPHLVCTYLYELAQTFNRFYENNKVIGDARENERLSLVTSYANTLKNVLNLIGIQAPEQM